ncbi:hypothetical protein PFTANZ_02030 [Plasmodium falciparum Tanzania (2000708)]|uniref:Uncharacterized protein n=2 Tax=Plasmodium falciparum TaxID=5833 RepID=A0A024W8L9_PLAFA|nr:hypothetical protein PFTANZ_02030 [Plasmodium falciparum Tanzania (2000708)]ETW43525.1 hypothetical protein PFNF135_02062 [Plasmodium falciparum NF135/5.C10]
MCDKILQHLHKYIHIYKYICKSLKNSLYLFSYNTHKREREKIYKTKKIKFICRISIYIKLHHII